jgi:hypothetical protein
MILGWVPKWKPKRYPHPGGHLHRRPSVRVTDTELALAVAPIPSSDGQYRPKSSRSPRDFNFPESGH